MQKIIEMKLPKTLLYVIIAVLSFFVVQQCSLKENEQNKRSNVRNFLNDTIEYYTNKQGKVVANIKALQGDKQTLEVLISESSKQLKELTEKFKTVSSAVEVEQKIKIDTVFVPYKKPIEYDFRKHWAKTDQWYRITGISTQKGVN